MKIVTTNGATLFECGAPNLRDCVVAALAAKTHLREADLRGADLRGANLREADLGGADLRVANLREADLGGADLRGANLRVADLRGADLRVADLRVADLRVADLRWANLREADLRWADLRGADLRVADLRGANLREANLREADLLKLVSHRRICPEGELIVWKNLRAGVICKLRIPADAKRVGGVIGRKCRAEYAVVLEGEGTSRFDLNTIYKVGETVRPDRFDPNPLVDCSSGIHFFITRLEAEEYS